MKYTLKMLRHKVVAVLDAGPDTAREKLKQVMRRLTKQTGKGKVITPQTQQFVVAFFADTMSRKNGADFKFMVNSREFKLLLDKIGTSRVLGDTPVVTFFDKLADTLNRKMTPDETKNLNSLLESMFLNPSFTRRDQFPTTRKDGKLGYDNTKSFDLMKKLVPTTETEDDAAALVKFAMLLNQLFPLSVGSGQTGKTQCFPTAPELVVFAISLLSPVAHSLFNAMSFKKVDGTVIKQKTTDLNIPAKDRGVTLLSAALASYIEKLCQDNPNAIEALKQIARVFNAFLKTPESMKIFERLGLPTDSEA